MYICFLKNISISKGDYHNYYVSLQSWAYGPHFQGVAAVFPSRSMPSGSHPQAGLSAILGVAALWAADYKFTINSYFE